MGLDTSIKIISIKNKKKCRKCFTGEPTWEPLPLFNRCISYLEWFLMKRTELFFWVQKAVEDKIYVNFSIAPKSRRPACHSAGESAFQRWSRFRKSPIIVSIRYSGMWNEFSAEQIFEGDIQSRGTSSTAVRNKYERNCWRSSVCWRLLSELLCFFSRASGC